MCGRDGLLCRHARIVFPVFAKGGFSLKRNRKLMMMALPALLMLVVFIVFPLVNAIRLSLFKWNGYSQRMSFLGLGNYADIFTDSLFYRSLGNTLIYGFGSTLLQNVFGLILALYLNMKFRGRNIIRVVVYLPIMVAQFIMGQIMYYFVQYQGGVLNEILSMFGAEPVYWMSSGIAAVILITLVNSWQYVGLCMVVYLAGLQGIPDMYREAARLDGVSRLQEFRHITLPLLVPSITTAVVINLINGLKMYDMIVSMSSGGPNRGSLSLSYYIQLLYFNDEKAGYAAALGVVTIVVIMILTLPINRFLKKREVEY